MPQALLKISGRVQGVFFRASAKEVADRLKLKGYAKNMPDGSVESLVQGEKFNIEDFIKWCKEGPEHGITENLQIKWEEETEGLDGFKIL